MSFDWFDRGSRLSVWLTLLPKGRNWPNRCKILHLLTFIFRHTIFDRCKILHLSRAGVGWRAAGCGCQGRTHENTKDKGPFAFQLVGEER